MVTHISEYHQKIDTPRFIIQSFKHLELICVQFFASALQIYDFMSYIQWKYHYIDNDVPFWLINIRSIDW